MTHDELCAAITAAGFETGWAVRDGKIVVWENAEPVPDELSDCVELD